MKAALIFSLPALAPASAIICLDVQGLSGLIQGPEHKQNEPPAMLNPAPIDPLPRRSAEICRGTLRLSYTTPLDDAQSYALRVRVPVTYVDVLGDDGYDIGDASLEISHVFGLTKQHAFVAKGELIFDTAARPELGTGQNVFKGTFIYAKFLQSGSIFAPALVQSNSLWGDGNRPDVNSTTIDFYYVPKLANPKNLITYDPALNFDWENDKQFFSLAITFGRVLGPQLGGNGILFVKPSVFAGSDRPSSWGMEVGYKVIGF
jgi:hypothetical protein